MGASRSSEQRIQSTNRGSATRVLALFVAVASTAAACGGDGEGDAGAAGVAGAVGAAATGGTPTSGGTGAVAAGGAGASGTGVAAMPGGGTGAGAAAGGVGVTPGDGGMPAADAGTADPCIYAPDAVPTGACDNAADCAVVESGAVAAESDRCGRMCVLNGVECTVMCMTDAVEVTPECARCYAEIVQCSAVNCALSCFADSAGMPCRMCVDTMCTPAFDACTGSM